jgi:hypothetical protein
MRPACLAKAAFFDIEFLTSKTIETHSGHPVGAEFLIGYEAKRNPLSDS